MKRKHITLVVLVIVGTVVAGVGLVTAIHEPVDPEDVYIHEVQTVRQSTDAQICVQNVNDELNIVTIEGTTTHFDTTIYHGQNDQPGEQGDVVLEIPKLRTPNPHHIVLHTNGESSTVNSVDGTQGDGQASCVSTAGQDVGSFVLGVYSLETGTINLLEGVEVRAGPNEAADAPEPGSGTATLGTASTTTEPGIDTSQTDGDDSDDSVLNETLDQTDDDSTAGAVGLTGALALLGILSALVRHRSS